MADILSQDEIDALLSTVSDEPAGEGSGGDSGDDFDDFAPDFVPKKISVYDFRRPDRVSKEQLRSIRNLHDKFARNFSSNSILPWRRISCIHFASSMESFPPEMQTATRSPSCSI